MTALPFPTSSSPGVLGHDSGGRLVNAMVQKLGGALENALVYRRSPGLVNAFATTATGYRGSIVAGSGLYLIQRNSAFYVTYSGGVYTTLRIGNIPGDKPVTLARNNFEPEPDVICVHEYGQSRLTPTSAVLFRDEDLPDPNSIFFLDGFFVWTIEDGLLFASGINSTTVSALDFATAESRPDGLSRGVRRGQEAIFFGTQSIEFFTNRGALTGFPFDRTTTVSGGIIGTHAVTGWEDGLPPNTPIYFVGPDNAVYVLPGYQPSPISTLDVNRAIQNDPNKSSIRMASFVSEGILFVMLQLTAATWIYDTRHSSWHERASYGQTVWRCDGTFTAFDKWFAGDRVTGQIYEISSGVYAEGIEPLVWMLESGPGKAFPQRLKISRVEFDFATGLPGLDRDPMVSISSSDDGAKTWGNPILRSLGNSGQYSTAISLLRQGMTGPKGRRYRVEVADPVPVAFIGADMVVEPRAR